jgi:hypothetical protein
MSEIKESDGQEIMRLFVDEIKRRLRETPGELKAADFEMIRKMLADNSITMASVQRGDYGDFARGVAEQFPFSPDDGDAPQFTN